MKIAKRVFLAVGVLGVSGCSVEVSPTRSFDPIYFAVSENSEAAANGLSFADGSQTLSSVESNEMTVRLIRFQRDPITGESAFVVSTETVTLDAGSTEFRMNGEVSPINGSMTVDGASVTFVDGQATLPSGQVFGAHLASKREYSGTFGVYAASDATNPLEGEVDIEGLFVMGHETDPSILTATSGEVTYIGQLRGYTQLFDSNGTLSERDVLTTGGMQLVAEFSDSRISGKMIGQLKAEQGDLLYELVFLGAPLTGNGFVGVADITCPSGHSCSSDTSVSGVFFGPNGEEVSGVIALDESISGPEGYSFKGTAGFSTTNAPSD